MTTKKLNTLNKAMRGFAILKATNPTLLRQITSSGGRAVHEKGTGHEFTSEEARAARWKQGLQGMVTGHKFTPRPGPRERSR